MANIDDMEFKPKSSKSRLLTVVCDKHGKQPKTHWCLHDNEGYCPLCYAELVTSPSNTKKEHLSLVEGSGVIERPEYKKDEIIFRDSTAALRNVDNLQPLVEALHGLVEEFHDRVQQIAKNHGVHLKDFVDFQIIQD